MESISFTKLHCNYGNVRRNYVDTCYSRSYQDFHVSYSMSSWILTAYLVAGAVMTPIAGKLSDIYGRKRILLIIMVIYAVGVSLSAFATNIYFMIVARAIQGIGMSMFPIAFGIVRDVFP